jgi:hypothetical protein
MEAAAHNPERTKCQTVDHARDADMPDAAKKMIDDQRLKNIA